MLGRDRSLLVFFFIRSLGIFCQCLEEPGLSQLFYKSETGLFLALSNYNKGTNKKVAHMNEFFAIIVLNIEMLILQMYFKMFICDFYIQKM